MSNETQNADPAEIEKFSEQAHTWWDLEGEFRPLHEINPIRLDWIDNLANLSGKRALDVGCGGGILSDAMARRGAQVLGIDLAEKALRVAELHALEAQTPGVTYRSIAVEELARNEPASFDVVTCMEMLEHVPDPSSVVEATAELVRPGGWVFFSTINRNAKAFALAIVGAEYIARLLPRGTHEYARFIRPSELARMAREAGLEVVAESGVAYNPLLRRATLTDDASVNYMFACRRPTADVH